MGILKDGMSGIATAVEESTKGIVSVADNKRISEELRAEVDKFRQ